MNAFSWMTQSFKFLNYLAVSTYEGVDPRFSGNGGIECYQFLSWKQRLLETVLYSFFLFLLVLPRVKTCIHIPDTLPPCRLGGATKIDGVRKVLLVLLCLVFGIELGFKFATKQLIYVLNPCHLVTLTQIYLLSSEPTKFSLAVFRIHVHWLFGAFLAIILPVLNVRLLPFEVATYWIQHLLIFFVIPPYLMACGGPFTPEPLSDFSWPLLALLFFAFHMFYILQGIGMMTLVNLNSMLCPAVSDPFHGPYYRWAGIVHQTLLVIFFGKVYTLITNLILNLFVSHGSVGAKQVKEQ